MEKPYRRAAVINIDLAMIGVIIGMGLSYCMGYAKGVMSCKDPSPRNEDESGNE